METIIVGEAAFILGVVGIFLAGAILIGLFSLWEHR